MTLTLPSSFTFYRRGIVDFDQFLEILPPALQEREVVIDTSNCMTSNFQSLALLVQYAWLQVAAGHDVSFKYGGPSANVTRMLDKMGAMNWRHVLLNDGTDFQKTGKRNCALRRRSDVQNTINHARAAIQDTSVKFPDYLSYIVAELLYNATEHGKKLANINGNRVIIPSVFSYGYYPLLNRLSFLFSDLGIGIKAHLESYYPPFAHHAEAILYALTPQVSGTFGTNNGPYAAQDNAGLGLTYSSLMLKRLNADMYIVSQDGLVHVSPEDVTSRQMSSRWPGTFVLVNINMKSPIDVTLAELMQDIDRKAFSEVKASNESVQELTLNVSIFNYFGKYAEDKGAGITYRDRTLLPALTDNKRVVLDFTGVETAPHSFLNALLATAINRLGIQAYQRIRIYNADPAIRNIIDGIFEANIPNIQ